MSKKRGLSVEEKRERMMELFYEKKDFFQLKELEKLCQKEKGITSMTVKEILTSLVDDGMVDTEKIGTCVYFWAFPSKASQNRRRKCDELMLQLNDSENKRVTLDKQIKESSVGREDNVERSSILLALAEKQKIKQDLQEEIKTYRDCDPEIMEQMKNEMQMAKDAANRWTDNIMATKSWIKRKFPISESDLNKQFDIPEDLDYLD